MQDWPVRLVAFTSVPQLSTDACCVATCFGKKAYSLTARPAVIAPFAGKHVQVQGAVKQHVNRCKHQSSPPPVHV